MSSEEPRVLGGKNGIDKRKEEELFEGPKGAKSLPIWEGKTKNKIQDDKKGHAPVTS